MKTGSSQSIFHLSPSQKADLASLARVMPTLLLEHEVLRLDFESFCDRRSIPLGRFRSRDRLESLSVLYLLDRNPQSVLSLLSAPTQTIS
jgi:hypothetical protein